MMTESSSLCLLIRGVANADVLDTEQTAASLDAYENAELVDISAEWGPGFTTVFVDWLRRGGEIIGVGLTPMGEFEWLLGFDNFDNVEIESGARMLIFFSETQSFERNSSNEHLMLRTRIFQNPLREEFLLLVELDEAIRLLSKAT